MICDLPSGTAAFCDALTASGPNADLPAVEDLFGRLVGSWDLDVRWFEDGRETRRENGEWHFSWILDGRAVQVVWIVPSRPARAAGAKSYEYGTSVRFYDAALGPDRPLDEIAAAA